MTASPWAFHLHPLSWSLVLVLAAAYGTAVRRPRWQATFGQVCCFFGGLALLLAALTWPMADVAAHFSLTALVLQRLVLMIAVPPLLILGTPENLLVSLTRPAPVDTVVRACSRPPVAVAVVTVLAVGTLTVATVDAQASSLPARAALDLVLLVAGCVLWAPVLDRLPGTRRPSAFGQAGYLIVQSIVPSFLAIVWIFARHPLYPAYAHQHAVFGMSPVLDQQLAGFAAKFGTIISLWTVSFIILSRAQHIAATGGDPDPLRWVDVERHLERAARRERRAANPGFPMAPPRPAPGPASTGPPEEVPGPENEALGDD